MRKNEKSLIFQSISIRTILPNVVTLMAFIAGLSAIKFALSEKWELAAGAIVFAGIFDGLDGQVARLLKSTSKFGAELDSLSDVVAFGVAPAVLLYLWGLQELDRLGWAVAIIYACAMALRLARFNARMDLEDDPKSRVGFLTGVPAPAGAGLLLAPMMVEFSFGQEYLVSKPIVAAAYGVMIAVLLVSTIPTVSLKAFRLKKSFFAPFMLLIAATIAGLFAHTWLVLLLIAILYLVSLPFCLIAYNRRRQKRMKK